MGGTVFKYRQFYDSNVNLSVNEENLVSKYVIAFVLIFASKKSNASSIQVLIIVQDIQKLRENLLIKTWKNCYCM